MTNTAVSPERECFNAICGFDEEHEHGEECTIDCPCGEGAVDLAEV